MDQTSNEKVEIKFRVTSKLTNQKPWSEKWAVKMGDGEEFVVTEEILKLPDAANPPKVICIFSLFNGRLNYEQHDSGRITTLNGAVVGSQVVSEGSSVEVGEGTKIEIVKAPALGAPSAQTHDGPSIVAGPAAGSNLGNSDGPDIAFDEEALAQEKNMAQAATSSLPDPDRDLQLGEGDAVGLEMDTPMIAEATQSQASVNANQHSGGAEDSEEGALGETLDPIQENEAIEAPAQGTKGTVLGKLRGILKGNKESTEKKSLRPEPIAVPREHMTHSFTGAHESSGLKTGNHAYAKKLEKAEKTLADLKLNQNVVHRLKNRLLASPQARQNAKTAAAVLVAAITGVLLVKVVNRKNTAVTTASAPEAGEHSETVALKIHSYDPGISIQEIDRRIPIIDALASRSPVSEGGRISTIRNQPVDRAQPAARSNIRPNPNMRNAPRRR